MLRLRSLNAPAALRTSDVGMDLCGIDVDELVCVFQEALELDGRVECSSIWRDVQRGSLIQCQF